MKNEGKVFIVCVCFLASYLFATSNIRGAEEEQLINERTLNSDDSNAPSLPIAEIIPMTSKTKDGIQDLTWDGSYLWGIDGGVLDNKHYICKINPANGKIVDSFAAPNVSSVGDGSNGIAYGDGYLWVLNSLDDFIYAVNPSTGRVDNDKSIALTGIPGFANVYSGGAWDGEYFWFGMNDYNGNSAKIYQVHVDSATILERGTIAATSISDLEFAQGYLWAIIRDLSGTRYIYKIDPVSITVLEQYDRSMFITGLAYDGRYLWASDYFSSEYEKYIIAEDGETTTTTTVSDNDTAPDDGGCTAGKIYGEHSEKAELLRDFRDNVLHQTPEGQEMIRLYYELSPVIVKAMEKDEAFKEEIKETIDGFLGLVEEAD